jgi:hypothetical protein
MVRGLLTLAFLAGSAAFAENDPATRIAAIEARIGGRILLIKKTANAAQNLMPEFRRCAIRRSGFSCDS